MKIFLLVYVVGIMIICNHTVIAQDSVKYKIQKGQISDYYIPIVATYDINGKVVDEKNKPLKNVIVMLKNSPVSCLTDTGGYFQFEVSEKDSFLVFYYPQKKWTEIAIGKQKNLMIEVQLMPEKWTSSIVPTKPQITAWYNPYKYEPTTYCNPMDIEYTFEYYNNNSKAGNSFRSAADPMIQPYKGEYYLFTSNQSGFYTSKDLLQWEFHYSPFQRKPDDDDQCAPASEVLGDTLVYIGSTYRDLPVWYSTNPKNGKWKHLSESMLLPHWDPALFLNDDGRLYLYYGSSNEYPLKGVEIDRQTFQPISEVKNLMLLHPNEHGWERFGMNNDDSTSLKPFTEGAFMTKHNNKYYLQYGAPGTEFKVYADGTYVSDNPLGPFTYQTHNPISYKPGGFVQGAGHGGTFKDYANNYWHVGTCMLSLKYKFERRIGLYPSGFDKDGVMFVNTSFGDYPTFVQVKKEEFGKQNFSGWMLLSYHKKVNVSSEDSIFIASNASDENMRTYWSAKTNHSGEWLSMDLADTMLVYAIQTNFYEHQAYQYGKAADIYYQYKIYASMDGIHWQLVVDKSNNDKDQPHDYIELIQPLKTRFLKIENIHMPTGKFAIMDFRVFGKKQGVLPAIVKNFKVQRDTKDTRNAMISWNANPQAYGYNIYYSIAPDKMYHCITVYDNHHYNMRGLDKGTTYYFSIQALAETGVSPTTKILKVE